MTLWGKSCPKDDDSDMDVFQVGAKSLSISSSMGKQINSDHKNVMTTKSGIKRYIGKLKLI